MWSSVSIVVVIRSVGNFGCAVYKTSSSSLPSRLPWTFFFFVFGWNFWPCSCEIVLWIHSCRDSVGSFLPPQTTTITTSPVRCNHLLLPPADWFATAVPPCPVWAVQILRAFHQRAVDMAPVFFPWWPCQYHLNLLSRPINPFPMSNQQQQQYHHRHPGCHPKIPCSKLRTTTRQTRLLLRHEHPQLNRPCLPCTLAWP